MAIKPARLRATLAQSKVQKDNNALWQTITGIIGQIEAGLAGFLTVSAFNDYINAVRYTTVIEIDCSGGPVSIALSDYVFNNFYIFKDITGSAGGNTITLTGTVDGVVDPTITTNYGFLRVYRSLSFDTMHQW